MNDQETVENNFEEAQSSGEDFDSAPPVVVALPTANRKRAPAPAINSKRMKSKAAIDALVRKHLENFGDSSEEEEEDKPAPPTPPRGRKTQRPATPPSSPVRTPSPAAPAPPVKKTRAPLSEKRLEQLARAREKAADSRRAKAAARRQQEMEEAAERAAERVLAVTAEAKKEKKKRKKEQKQVIEPAAAPAPAPEPVYNDPVPSRRQFTPHSPRIHPHLLRPAF